MKSIKTSRKTSKIKLSLADFALDEIRNSTSVVGGRVKGTTTYTTCTAGDVGCCDDPVPSDYII